MQRSLIALLAAAAALPTPAAAATRSYSVTSFDRIRVEGPFAVTLITSAGSSARAEGPDARMLGGVRLDMMGRTLVIRRDRDATQGGSLRGIRIALTTPALLGATVLGAGSLTVATGRGARFDAGVSGAGSLGVTGLDTDLLNVTITGAGSTKLAGRTRALRAVVQGAGVIDAPDLATQDATIVTAGSGTITVAATRTAKVNATGAGAITILGTPACTVASEGTVDITCDGPNAR
ncbi:GIN domain-containing protein [Sphingomonas arantia]|uniref:GIN domain-containing protein n=1 Tax=Sphingomonas arantia TaxID=1460676 RepID=A0ABW4U1Q0_9SPHN